MSPDLEGRLVNAGLSAAEAVRKVELFEAATLAVKTLAGADLRPKRWFVPGRIEFLGKHTDYAGGRSLLCTIERGFCVVALPRSDQLVRIADATRSEDPVELSLALDRSPARPPRSTLSTLSTSSTSSTGGWTVYAQTVVRRVARNFSGNLHGVDIAFASDLPRAAGLSSSSALVTAIFTVLSDVNDLCERLEYRSNIRCPEDLAGYLGSIENGQSFGTLDGDAGVGTFGGSEDHTAILCSHPGHLCLYTFCPVRKEGVVPLLDGYTFVIGSSGSAAKKTGNAREKYNRVSLAASSVLELWRTETGRADPTLRAAATCAPDAPDRIRDILRRSMDARFEAQALLDRFDQFLEESERIIPMATEALRNGELSALGELVDRSQATAERLLGNQIPETIELARLARAQGAAAASAFGAGFGGSVWALVRTSQALGFRGTWEVSYRELFPRSAETSQFFASGAGPALIRL